MTIPQTLTASDKDVFTPDRVSNKPSLNEAFLLDMETEEIWISIKGFEDSYEVSNLGRVRSVCRVVNQGKYGNTRTIPKKILSTTSHKNGYIQIPLRRNGIIKWFLIHRLVAIHFIENPHNKPDVNHIDSVRTNNYYSNLEWVTKKENTAHAWANGRMEKIRERTPTQILNGKKLGEKFGAQNGKKLSELYSRNRNVFNNMKAHFDIFNNSGDADELSLAKKFAKQLISELPKKYGSRWDKANHILSI